MIVGCIKHTITMDQCENLQVHKCEICEIALKTKTSLRNHLKSVHNYDEDEHKCNVCSKNFNSKDILKEHIKMLHGDKK